MSTKFYLNQLKLAKVFTVKAFKKRKFKVSLVVNLHSEIKNNKLNIANTSNSKIKFKIWF